MSDFDLSPDDAGVEYSDRVDAGRTLAALLARYSLANGIVLALPRGGVVVGYEIAMALGLPLDVIVARKLGAPMQPEYGFGAVAPGDIALVDSHSAEDLGITSAVLDQIIANERREMERRLICYRGDRPPPTLAGRTVVLVDDGIATGVTARAAIRSIRLQAVERLYLAAPVCAQETAVRFRDEVDLLICPRMPLHFDAVGLWYRDFAQVTDDEVVDLLERAARRPARPER